MLPTAFARSCSVALRYIMYFQFCQDNGNVLLMSANHTAVVLVLQGRHIACSHLSALPDQRTSAT